MKTIQEQAMRKAEKSGTPEAVVRHGAELCIVWDRRKLGKSQVQYRGHCVVAESAGHARRVEEMLETLSFNIGKTPGEKLEAVLLYAGAERAAAEIRCKR